MRVEIRFRRSGFPSVAGMLVTRCIAVCVAFLAAMADAGVVRLPVTRDVWISAHPGEERGNNGASPKIKFKGIQEFTLFDFDHAALGTARIVRGALWVRMAGAEMLGRVTVSTVAVPWIEGDGTGYAERPGAACFLMPGCTPDLTAAILGAGGSIWRFADATPLDAEGWQRIPVDRAILDACRAGQSHGVFVMDDVGSEYRRDGDRFEALPFRNRFFHSREAGAKRAPYFEVELEGGARRTEPSEPSPREADRERTTAEDGGSIPELPPSTVVSVARSIDGLTDLFGEPVGGVALARNEIAWLRVRREAPFIARARVVGGSGLRVALYPVGAHGDALATGPDGGIGASAEWLVECAASRDALAGRATIALAYGEEGDGVGEVEVPVVIWRFALPSHLSFLPQMNAYRLPRDEMAYYKMAHAHRVCLNCLRYSWKGHVEEGCAPVREEDGRWDWSAWDARFGPLLDGSAFGGSLRGGIPVEAMYLPLNENWPMDHERHFRGGYWIEDAYAPEYWEEFRGGAREIAAHIAGRGWRETMFEFYLNNKVTFKAQRGAWGGSSAAWVFDEPMNTQDFWALRRFGREFLSVAWPYQLRRRTGSGEELTGSDAGASLVFRCDISRPQWQRDLLDGICGEQVIGAALRRYSGLVAARNRAQGGSVLLYGSANRPGTPNTMIPLWCLDAWRLGADGIVPWQTIGTSAAWATPEQTCLFYPGARGPVASLRLKAFTYAQQLIELLTLYRIHGARTREALAREVEGWFGFEGEVERRGADDAGTLRYADARAAGRLAELRARLGTWLNARAPEDRDRLIDLRPAARDPGSFEDDARFRARDQGSLEHGYRG